MHLTRALVISNNWLDKAVNHLAGLKNIQPCFQIIPIPDYESLTKNRFSKLVTRALKNCSAQSAIVILPTSYALGTCVKYWPDIFIHTQSGILITSVVFSDEWTDCRPMIDSFLRTSVPGTGKYNATCQYQPPYTDVLNQWVEAGAENFHPGDYFKNEFLNELSKMQGHWLYWGHADSEKLRGYHHLFSDDILDHKPESPLQSTLWFSCATLDKNKEHNIALEWFLSGATQCLMASLEAIKTKDNQLLGSAWLEICQHQEVSNIADIIYHLLMQDEQTFGPILENYRLMGSPWVDFV